jgi:hypothetical protein
MAISTFDSYRSTYAPRSPELTPKSDDEKRLLNSSDGVQEFEDAPCSVVTQDMVPSTKNLDKDKEKNKEKKFLWVIRESDIPFIREHTTVTPLLSSGRCTHTNLTGGADAYCGGEVWFASERRLILNGGSGRYPPKEPDELDVVVVSFEQAGYRVWSMGWDDGIDQPARVLKGVPPWETRD